MCTCLAHFALFPNWNWTRVIKLACGNRFARTTETHPCWHPSEPLHFEASSRTLSEECRAVAGRNRQCKHFFEHRSDVAVKCYMGHPYPILIQRCLEYGTTMCRSAIQRTVPIMQTLFRARRCYRKGKNSPSTTWSMKLQGSLYAYLRNKGFQLTIPPGSEF